MAAANYRNRLMSEAQAVAFPAQALELRHADPTLAPIGPELLTFRLLLRALSF